MYKGRNRLISGLSLGVLVIEAARRSGTLVTARYGAEQNREVFAVPGHPLDPRAEGTNQLLKSGATLVTVSADILEFLKPLATGPDADSTSFREPAQLRMDHASRSGLPDSSPATGSSHQNSGSDDNRALVLSALGAAPIDIDELARATGLAIRDVNVVLLELDMAGLIVRHGLQLVSRTQDVA